VECKSVVAGITVRLRGVTGLMQGTVEDFT